MELRSVAWCPICQIRVEKNFSSIDPITHSRVWLCHNDTCFIIWRRYLAGFLRVEVTQHEYNDQQEGERGD